MEPSIGEATWFGWAGGWLGSVAMIVGTGKLFFLDNH